MADSIEIGNIVSCNDELNTWGYVLNIDKENNIAVVCDQLIGYDQNFPLDQITKIHSGITNFKSLYQIEKEDNVVDPDASSINSFQAPISDFDPLIPSRYTNIETPEAPEWLTRSPMYFCNVSDNDDNYVTNEDLCHLISVASLPATYIPKSIYDIYMDKKYSIMCQPEFYVFTHYMSNEVKSFELTNVFARDPVCQLIQNIDRDNNIYVEDLQGVKKNYKKKNIYMIPNKSEFISFYSIAIHGPFTSIGFHIIIRDEVALHSIFESISHPIDAPIVINKDMHLGHYINFLKEMYSYIYNPNAIKRFKDIMICFASVYLSSLHVPTVMNISLNTSPSQQFTIPQPFMYICQDNYIQRYLQARYIYVDPQGQNNKTIVNTEDEIQSSIERNRVRYHFKENIMDIIDTVRSRGAEIIIECDDTERQQNKPYRNIYIEDGDVCIPICHEGMNRSQVLYALLLSLSVPSNPPHIHVYTSHGAVSGWDLGDRIINKDNYYEIMHSDLDRLDRTTYKDLNRYKEYYTVEEEENAKQDEIKNSIIHDKVFLKERGGENDSRRYNEDNIDTSLEAYYRAFGIEKQPRYGDYIGKYIPLNVDIKKENYDHIRYNRSMCSKYFTHVFYNQLERKEVSKYISPFHIKDNKNHIYYFCFARSFQYVLERLSNLPRGKDENGIEIAKDLEKIRIVWLPLPDTINTTGTDDDIDYWQSLGIADVTRSLLQANSYLYIYRLYSSFIHTSLDNYILRDIKERDIYNDSLKTNNNFYDSLFDDNFDDNDFDINNIYQKCLDVNRLQLINNYNSSISLYKDTTKNNQLYITMMINKEDYPYMDIYRDKLIYEQYIKATGRPFLPLSHVYTCLPIQDTTINNDCTINYDLLMYGPIENNENIYTLEEYIKKYPYNTNELKYIFYIYYIYYIYYIFSLIRIIIIYNDKPLFINFTHSVIDAMKNPSSCLQINSSILCPAIFNDELSTPLETYILGCLFYACVTGDIYDSFNIQLCIDNLNNKHIDQDIIDTIIALVNTDINTKLTSFEILSTFKLFNNIQQLL
ncbi:hypothetical protein WA158_001979 [Blastocystis sp. Blastoise]